MNQLHRCASISTFLGVAAPLIFIAVGGCGGAPAPDRPKTVPVQGTITLKGQPLADASVTFMLPDNSGSAVGRTDAAGHYSLTTFEQGDGAIPGEWRIRCPGRQVRGTAPRSQGWGDAAAEEPYPR
jgi:hypothetical protein